MLANAHPPANGNMLGYSDAVLVLWLLQPPIALGEESKINVMVMARCNMQGHNPVPGYLLTQLPSLSPKPPDRPATGQKPTWILRGGTAGPLGNTDMTNSEYGNWAAWHTGDAWLGGGWYFNFVNAHNTVPTLSGTKGVSILGEPRWGAVYIMSDKSPEWETNRQHKAVPKYFAAFLSPISRWVYLVGFTNFEWAKNQAAGLTGLVPADVELCITYGNAPPKWEQFNGDNSTDKVQTYFYEVYRAEHERTGVIYSNVVPIQDNDYPMDTYGAQAVANPYDLAPYLPTSALGFPHLPLANQTATPPWQLAYLQQRGSTNWLSETRTPWSQLEHLLQPRYSASNAGSMTSTTSSSWSLHTDEEHQERPAPSAPEMGLDTLIRHLRDLGLSSDQLAMRLLNPTQDEEPSIVPIPEEPPEQSATSTDSPEESPDGEHSDQHPETAPSDADSPVPQNRAGLPNWGALWMRALQHAGMAPGAGYVHMP